MTDEINRLAKLIAELDAEIESGQIRRLDSFTELLRRRNAMARRKRELEHEAFAPEYRMEKPRPITKDDVDAADRYADYLAEVIKWK